MQRARVPSAVVVSDQTLVSQAVQAALQGRGFEVTTSRWPGGAIALPRCGGGAAPATAPDVGLLVSALDSPSRIRAARAVIRGTATRWMVIAGVPAGPAWGGVLDAGAMQVVPSTSTLGQIEAHLHALASGVVMTDQSWRAGLLEAWTREHHRRAELAVRLASLTSRERQVLDLLYAGRPVTEVARALGVAPATVRSQVKAVLHKLGVGSQLAAVSLLDDTGEPGHSRART